MIPLIAGIFLCALSGFSYAQEPASFTAQDRILILAPHPDDEVLGTAGVIQRARAAHAQVKIAFLTYGDNNAWSFTVFKKHPVVTPRGMRAMGEVRRQEAIQAAHILGVDAQNLIFLGYPDHGTLDIWCYNWDMLHPFRSEMTLVRKVPYQDAYHLNAPYVGDSITHDIKKILLEYKPTQIFVTGPADENPDHRALYLFTRIALWDLGTDINPTVHPFIVHYRFRHWPVPQGYHPELPLEPPHGLRHDIGWWTFPLTAQETTLKYKALMEHQTQYKYSGKYLSSFVRTNELFGDYPIVRVRAGQPAALDDDEGEKKADLPPNFTVEEKDAFVDLDRRNVSIEDGNLVIATSYQRPFKNKFQFDLYVFGYRADRQFKDMPKIRVIVRKTKTAVFDSRKKLVTSGVEIVRKPNLLTVKVPLSLLGDPDRLLTGIHTSLEETPLDVMAWRALYLK